VDAREVLFPCALIGTELISLNLMMAPSFFQFRSLISVVPESLMMARRRSSVAGRRGFFPDLPWIRAADLFPRALIA
jgi:hypothetical protein